MRGPRVEQEVGKVREKRRPGRVASKPKSMVRVTSKRAPKDDGPEENPSRLIDQRIRELGGWRGESLARMRALILEADAEMVEEWKWGGTPVWSRHGIVCTGEAYAKVVKLTFARGARIPDPSSLFNASLQGNARRAIDIQEGEFVPAGAFRNLVKAAVALNRSSARVTSGAREAKRVRRDG